MDLFVVLVSICILFPQDQTEQAVGSHLSAPELTLQPLFSTQRFPNVVVAMDGTIVATWGQDHLRSRRSCDGGKTWEPVVDIRRGDSIHGGGCLVDERSGDLLFFAETSHPPATRLMFRSQDQGQSWINSPIEVQPNSLGHVASLHMNESGLTTRHELWLDGGNGSFGYSRSRDPGFQQRGKRIRTKTRNGLGQFRWWTNLAHQTTRF